MTETPTPTDTPTTTAHPCPTTRIDTCDPKPTMLQFTTPSPQNPRDPGTNLVAEETCLEKFSTPNSGAIFPITFNDCGAIFPILFFGHQVQNLYPVLAMRQRILGSHTPPCHRRMVITTQFNVHCAGGGGGVKGFAKFATPNTPKRHHYPNHFTSTATIYRKRKSLREKTPLFHTLGGHGGRLMPYSYCAVRLCLLRPLRMRIWAKFARTSREFGPFFVYGHAHLHHNKASPFCHKPSKRTMLAVCGV